MDCGGKRSATPLLGEPRTTRKFSPKEIRASFRLFDVFHGSTSRPSESSGVAAALCHCTPRPRGMIGNAGHHRGLALEVAAEPPQNELELRGG
jgi:hypothetical protein